MYQTPGPSSSSAAKIEIPTSEDLVTQLATKQQLENPNDLELSVENLVRTNCEIIAELRELLEAVQYYRKRTNFVKTAGTTMGVGGAIALCAAPFTGGMSASVAVSGAVATGTSAVTSIGSSIAYKRKQKHFTQNIERLEQKQQLAAQELTLKLNIINSVVEEIVSNVGLDERVALKTTLYHISKKTVRLVINGCDFILKDTVIGKQIIDQMHRLKDIAVAVIISKGLNTQEITQELTMSSPIVNAALRFTESATKEFNEVQMLVKSSAQSVKGISSRAILHGVGAAVGVIFSVIDIALLIRDWKNPDPLLGTIVKTIKDLQNDIGKCADILNILQNYEGEQSDVSDEQLEPETSTEEDNNTSSISNNGSNNNEQN